MLGEFDFGWNILLIFCRISSIPWPTLTDGIVNDSPELADVDLKKGRKKSIIMKNIFCYSVQSYENFYY